MHEYPLKAIVNFELCFSQPDRLEEETSAIGASLCEIESFKQSSPLYGSDAAEPLNLSKNNSEKKQEKEKKII